MVALASVLSAPKPVVVGAGEGWDQTALLKV